MGIKNAIWFSISFLISVIIPGNWGCSWHISAVFCRWMLTVSLHWYVQHCFRYIQTGVHLIHMSSSTCIGQANMSKPVVFYSVWMWDVLVFRARNNDTVNKMKLFFLIKIVFSRHFVLGNTHKILIFFQENFLLNNWCWWENLLLKLNYIKFYFLSVLTLIHLSPTQIIYIFGSILGHI